MKPVVCHRPLLVFIHLLLIVVLPATAHADKRADEIVSRILQEYGGTEAIGRIRTVAARGTIVDFFAGTEGAYNRYFERPGRLRVEIMPDRDGEVRILNGNDAWQSGQSGIVKARPLTRCSMRYQYAYLDLPMGFADKTLPVAYDGTEQFGDHVAHLLRITLPDAPEVRVYVDTTTFMIVRVATDFSMGIMGESELSTEYGDFRPENGVLFPHLLSNYAGEIKLSEITLPQIQVNALLPAPLFSPAPSARR